MPMYLIENKCDIKSTAGDQVTQLLLSFTYTGELLNVVSMQKIAVPSNLARCPIQ